ncbi:hypothetical protein F4780DRAFT_171279 [Xylariomycetidae sp. FL0641]|nr:hypothetical protein F4780DRAFT_171279 [Xylariomycetidae sp. FL0641]
MPEINGKKMACAPCIRGHRSTKCMHEKAGRVMIEVRKPGRPLSSCPHSNAKDCQCVGVTAAIPRQSKCGCSGGDNASQNNTEGAPPTNTSASQSSAEQGVHVKAECSNCSHAPPSSPRKSGFNRVQKTAPGSQKASSRKQSYDLSALQKMDPSSYNIVNQHPPVDMNAVTMGQMAPPPVSTSYMLPQQNGFHQAGAFPAQVQYPPPMPSLLNTGLATFAVPQPGGLTSMSPTIGPMNNGSAWSNVDSGASSVAQHTPNSSDGSSTLGTPAEQPRSCCGRPAAEFPPPTPQGLSPQAFPPQQFPQHNLQQLQGQYITPASPISQFQPQSFVGMGPLKPTERIEANQDAISPMDRMGSLPMDRMEPMRTAEPMFSPSHSAPVQRLYGTFGQPLQFSHWQQSVSAPMIQSSQSCEPRPPALMYYTNHDCSCGLGCQCVGCIVHPFNTATTEYIRSAMDVQTRDNALSPPQAMPPNTNGDREFPTPDQASPNSDHTASDATQVPDEEKRLSPNDFLFVQYQWDGLSCEGESNSCPCGDDCQCVGCLIHGNAVDDARE